MALRSRTFTETMTTVLHLLFLRGPATIAGLVMAIVVDAVNRHSLSWAWAYVSQEGREVVAPFFAHPNAAASIEMVDAMRLCITASQHARPRGVFRRPSCSSTSSMPDARDGHFQFQADATLLPTTSQIIPSDRARGAAVTHALPEATALRRTIRQTDDRQATEAPTGHINEGWHLLKGRVTISLTSAW